MNNRNDMTVDSAVDIQPDDPGSEVDREQDAPSGATEPGHIIRENVEAISEDEPPPPRESDAILPEADIVMPDVDEANEKWKAEVRDAAARWDRLTEEDLLALGRHRGSLTELVQKRYSLSAAEAGLQVTDFIADHQSFHL